jgi:hypothetical protein
VPEEGTYYVPSSAIPEDASGSSGEITDAEIQQAIEHVRAAKNGEVK